MKIITFITMLAYFARFGETFHHLERIFGGEDADFDDSPYLVSLLYKSGRNVMYCGGTLIADRWILTAAHCIHNIKAKHIFAVTGNKNFVKRKRRNVKKLIVHESYVPDKLLNDIGLVKLDAPVHGIEFAELDSEETDHGLGVILGWGYREDGQPSLNLQKLDVAYGNCSTVKDEYMVDVTTLLCTQTDNSQGACIGDSGGPLIRTSNKKQIGIISAGLPCALGFPDVFTRVSSYVDWIESNINE